MKTKGKFQQAQADLKRNAETMKRALVKEQPLWKQAAYYGLSVGLMAVLATAVMSVCYLAAVWLMPNTVQLVVSSIGITGEAALIDLMLLLGLPCMLLAITYAILLARAVMALLRLYKPGMARVKRLLRFRTADGETDKKG